ncbi:MAG: hypothetical protein HZB27_12175 [Meiothermus silvanus]|nr:hypothetical protein [Allomeiothermus silvanus]
MPAKNAWAYLVRIWLEPGEGGEVWRASLTDLATRPQALRPAASLLSAVHPAAQSASPPRPG